ncbi:MAG: cell division transport system permease protein [Bradymonadia bacterium]|jgi:cell division transport system permease protein
MWAWITYFIRKAAESIRQSLLVQLVAVSTIAISMIVLGAFLLVLHNLDAMTARWSAEARIVAFLGEDAGPSQLKLAQRTVLMWPEVASVEVLSRAEALSRFRVALGRDAALLDGIDPGLVPASITLRLTPEARSPDGMEALSIRLGRLPGLGAVEKLDQGQDLVRRLSDVQALLNALGGILAALVACAVIFIISNTVRLTLYARRDELEVMQLVGATDRFIRVPVYLEGMFQAVLGATLAVLGLWVGLRLVAADGVIRFGQFETAVVFLDTGYCVSLVLLAAIVGFGASHLASSRFLKPRNL